MKITIISWDNLGYISLVQKEMERQGHVVHHIKMNELAYQYPNPWIKAQNAITKTIAGYNLKREILAQRVKQQLHLIPNQELILVVSADWLPTSIFQTFRTKSERIIGWFYDAAANYPRIPKMTKYMDKSYTFEPVDATNYPMDFLPNFNPYNQPYPLVNRSKYAYHIASDRDNRRQILNKIAAQLDSAHYPHRITLISNHSTIASSSSSIHVTSQKVDLKTVYQNLERATLQIDIQRKRQQGLSFRVLESIGLQQKLITTNAHIKSYDFYNPNNIWVIDADHINLPTHFLNTPYQPIPQDIFDKYTLQNWVKNILEI